MKPMCAAIRVGCVCAGLLVGIVANADWQFSHYVNRSDQETCSAILSQGHMIDGNMGHLPRGTLEMFRDTHTAQIRHDNGDMVGKPVLAFHWLYPRGDAHPEMRTFQYYIWDPRSERLLPKIGTALTRLWDIDYEVMNAHGMVYNSGMYAKWTPGNGYVERVGDVVESDMQPGTLEFVDIAGRRNRDYLAGSSVINSSYWWDIPEGVMGMLKSSEEFTLTVSFPGHAGRGTMSAANTGTLHPITVIWKIKGGDKAYGFVNTPGLCDWPVQ